MPFDHIADIYDKTFTHSHIGRLQRELVHRQLDHLLGEKTGAKVLELNCGTGEDALFLAKQGCEVLATDISFQMVKVATKKLKQSPYDKQVRFQQLAIEEIKQLPAKEQYDLIFSNFGGFNCVSPQDLASLRQDIADRLRPGGYFVAVIMSSFCLWETLYFLGKGQLRQAFRRQSKGPVYSPLAEGSSIATWYYSPFTFYSYFEQVFKKSSCHAIGFFLPPSYLEQAFVKRPQWLHRLNRWEHRWQNQSILAAASDHYMICLKKED